MRPEPRDAVNSQPSQGCARAVATVGEATQRMRWAFKLPLAGPGTASCAQRQGASLAGSVGDDQQRRLHRPATRGWASVDHGWPAKAPQDRPRHGGPCDCRPGRYRSPLGLNQRWPDQPLVSPTALISCSHQLLSSTGLINGSDQPVDQWGADHSGRSNQAGDVIRREK